MPTALPEASFTVMHGGLNPLVDSIPRGIEKANSSRYSELTLAVRTKTVYHATPATGHASVYLCWVLHADHKGTVFIYAYVLRLRERRQVERAGHESVSGSYALIQGPSTVSLIRCMFAELVYLRIRTNLCCCLRTLSQSALHTVIVSLD